MAKIELKPRVKFSRLAVPGNILSFGDSGRDTELCVLVLAVEGEKVITADLSQGSLAVRSRYDSKTGSFLRTDSGYFPELSQREFNIFGKKLNPAEAIREAYGRGLAA